MFCLYSSVFLCVVFMRVCVSAFGLMHIHPCIADFGRWEEKKEDGETELGQCVAELPAASECWMSEEGLEASGQNTERPGSASSHLARQPHVNITSTLTNMAALAHCESEGRLRHCCDNVVAWAITVTYSSLRQTSTTVGTEQNKLTTTDFLGFSSTIDF